MKLQNLNISELHDIDCWHNDALYGADVNGEWAPASGWAASPMTSVMTTVCWIHLYSWYQHRKRTWIGRIYCGAYSIIKVHKMGDTRLLQKSLENAAIVFVSNSVATGPISFVIKYNFLMCHKGPSVGQFRGQVGLLCATHYTFFLFQYCVFHHT